MFKVKEKVNTNEISLKGNMPDILTYLEREQERCPKMSIPQYLRLRELERAEAKQFGCDIRGYANAKRL